MGADLNVTVGALLIGVLVTAVGFGVTTMQTYMYMARFPKDSWTIKWTVWVLLLLDTAHVALSWHMTYYYLVLNYDNPEGLEDLVWSFNVTVVVTAIITMVVHCFYARRIHILSDRKWLITVAILSLSMARLVFGCIVTVRVFQIKVLKELSKKISGFVGGALGSGTLADCIITGTLTFYLQTHKSGYNTRTDNFVDKITYWTVNTGMLTSIVGIVVIITFSTMPHNMVFLAIHLFLSKLYANSLLATLNFRAAYHGRGVESDGSSMSGPSNFRARTGPEMPQIALTGKDTQLSPRNVHIITASSSDREYPSTGSDSFKLGDEGIRYEFDDSLASPDPSPISSRPV
ncbi:hypothetical protein V8D89_015434 [Ganoderma adspersum]